MKILSGHFSGYWSDPNMRIRKHWNKNVHIIGKGVHLIPRKHFFKIPFQLPPQNFQSTSRKNDYIQFVINIPGLYRANSFHITNVRFIEEQNWSRFLHYNNFYVVYRVWQSLTESDRVHESKLGDSFCLQNVHINNARDSDVCSGGIRSNWIASDSLLNVIKMEPMKAATIRLNVWKLSRYVMMNVV